MPVGNNREGGCEEDGGEINVCNPAYELGKKPPMDSLTQGALQQLKSTDLRAWGYERGR